MKVEYLIPYLSFLTPGSNLFISYLPDQIKSGVVILPSLTGGLIDPYVPEFKAADTFQIVSRDTDLAASRNTAEKVLEALTIKNPVTITGASISQPTWQDICIVSCRPIHEPIVYPRPLDGAWESSVNFSINWYYPDG